MRDLVAVLVADADDGGVGDPGVGEEQCLEFGGGDLEALVLDEFLHAVDDEEPAVLVNVADVAGVQPAVLVDHGGGGVGAAEVALHHLRAADEDLAGRADAEVLAGGVEGDDAHLGAGDQLADGPGRRLPMASRGTTWVPGDSSVMPYACPTGGSPSRREQAAARPASRVRRR
ncbi:hypothetical protein SHKM778_88570 [Streptomyces sp. KM77-8]|uniref:Uncharacterized protein n=1 Tax=Streptomyces haneummycinicus TaxID=3074435 RepID=A0AAT9HZ49_9ACTN